ncbi:unnamed protein product, partial [Brachionus calyciflorus]
MLILIEEGIKSLTNQMLMPSFGIDFGKHSNCISLENNMPMLLNFFMVPEPIKLNNIGKYL